MSKSHHYTYAILRYRHNAMIGESLNVGVALFSEKNGRFECRFNHKYSRLKQAFPTLDGDAYRLTIIAIEKGLRQFDGFAPTMVSPASRGVREIVEQVLRQDDSSFHWSEVGEGVSLDIETEIDFLFQKFVTWHEEINVSRKKDSDVWRPVRDALKKRKIHGHIEETKIESDLTEVKFENAWKNGRWHVFQPISLDLKTEGRIHEKVERWSGRLSHLKSACDEFKPYFLLGKPSDPSLADTYNDMIKALRASPCDPIVYPEEETAEFIDYIEDQIRTHIN